MKKLFVLTFICVSGVIACTKKAAPVTGVGGSGSGTSKTETPVANSGKPDVPNKSDDAGKIETETKPTAPSIPSGPMKPSDEESGKNIYTTKCTNCHAAKAAGTYTMNQWESILKRMIPKAKLTGDEESQLVAYIRANSK